MKQRSKKAWAKWRKLVSGQTRSGQSVASYCRDRGLCAPHFYVWKKRLREAEATRFVAVEVVNAEPERKPGPDTAIEIRLENGRSLMVGTEFDVGHLRALLAVLETKA